MSHSYSTGGWLLGRARNVRPGSAGAPRQSGFRANLERFALRGPDRALLVPITIARVFVRVKASDCRDATMDFGVVEPKGELPVTFPSETKLSGHRRVTLPDAP